MTEPLATLCIPWRPSPSRMRPFEAVMRFWKEHCPDWPIITADSDSEMFSLSQARNNAVQQAETEVVAVCDADTIPPLESVLAAVADPVGVCWPHAEWRLIPAEYAERPYEDFADAPILQRYENGLGSCLVTTRTEWWRLGGQDDRFEGWGFEDSAFHFVVATLSQLRKMPGITYAIEHNDVDGTADSPGWSRRPDNPARIRNMQLVRAYQVAAGRPWLMKEVLRTRYDPPPENDPLAGRFEG